MLPQVATTCENPDVTYAAWNNYCGPGNKHLRVLIMSLTPKLVCGDDFATFGVR